MAQPNGFAVSAYSRTSGDPTQEYPHARYDDFQRATDGAHHQEIIMSKPTQAGKNGGNSSVQEAKGSKSSSTASSGNASSAGKGNSQSTGSGSKSGTSAGKSSAKSK